MNEFSCREIIESSNGAVYESNITVPVYIAQDFFEKYMPIHSDDEMAIAIPTSDGHLVFVTNNFTKAPKWYQDAVLFHEEGHVILGHCDRIRSLADIMDMMRVEYEADEYSVSKGGKMKDALLRLESEAHIDLSDRIVNLS